MTDIRETIKQWIALEEEERALRETIKTIHARRAQLSIPILAHMKENNVDNFSLDGSSVGTLARYARQNRAPLKRTNLRLQLLSHFAGHHEKVRDFLEILEKPTDTPHTESLVLRRPRKTKS